MSTHNVGKERKCPDGKTINTRNKLEKETGYYDITTQTFSATYFISTEMNLNEISSQDFK